MTAKKFKNKNYTPDENTLTEVEELYKAGESLAGIQLIKAEMKNCYLVNADMPNSDLTRSDFSGASMFGINLEGSKLFKTNFK